MKIAIDYQSVLGRRTGIGDYASNLIPAIQRLYPEIELFLYQTKAADLSTAQRIAWESIGIPLRASKDRPDLIYSPGFSCALFTGFKRVVTVHDIIGVVFPNNQGIVSSFYWSRWLPYCLKNANFLAVSSEATKKDVEKHLGIASEKMQVVPCAARDHFKKLAKSELLEATTKKYGIGHPFFLAVGTLEPRKNHLRLIQAYEKMRQESGLNIDLVIIGKPASASQAVSRYVEEKGLLDRVKLLGYAPDADLVQLYNACIGYASVSLYEGFGLPALEAMRCGKSGVISNRSSLPEISGDTAILVNPESVDEMAQALKIYASDTSLRARLEEAAYKRAEQFNIDASAHQMVQIFHKAVGSGRG